MPSSDSDNFCYSILSKYPIIDVIPGLDGRVGVVALLVGLLYFFNSGLTIYWIRHQKFSAEMGIERAARHVVFPVYVPFMWASSLSDIVVGITILLVPLDVYDRNTWSASAVVSLGWALQHLVTEGVAFLLMQYGCGMEAAKRSFFYASIWGLVTFACCLGFTRGGNSVWGAVLLVAWTLVMLIFYGTIWLAPETSLFRRQALVGYSRFWTLFLVMNLVASSLLVADNSSNVGQCFYFFGPLLVYILCKPYVVYWALLSDSVWWQGVYQRAPTAAGGRVFMKGKGNTSVVENLVSPLFGIEVGFDDAQELGRQVDEMRTAGQVKLLNFAYLSLDKKSMLGCGSYSKVYRGKYRGTPVAIKLLFTVDLNPDIIKRCSKEAQLLSMISHPNVVEIFGVSVLPPSVCIVLEICHYGSLSDVIRGSAGGGVIRRALPLTHADRMFLALGCAKGLQALHNYSPTLCHRDVKSFNFLVDSQLNAKIADLELGGDEIELDHAGVTSPRSSSIGSGISVLSGEGGRHSLTQRSSSRRSKRAAKGDAFLCIWQAPEVLLGSPHVQASDVYALGLVLWEIISGNTPFSHYGRQDNIKSHIINGERPPFPRSCLDPAYKGIVEGCWAADYIKRPNIAEVVIALRICWEGSMHRHLFSTENLVDMPVIKEAYDMETERIEYIMSMNSSFSFYRDSASSSVLGSTPAGMSTQQARGSTLRASGAISNGIPPSPAVIAALEPLQHEGKLKVLDSLDAVYMLVSPEAPYIVLWASTKFPQLTGYFLSDILCRDLSVLAGPRTDSLSLRNLLAEAEVGQPGHRLVTMYRRDGSAFINSLHIFPVFVKFPGDERGFSTGLSRLLEEYILPLDRQEEKLSEMRNEGNTCESIERRIPPAADESASLLTDSRTIDSAPVADSTRATCSTSSGAASTAKSQSPAPVKPGAGDKKINDTDRLSFAKSPVLTTLSNGHQYVSSDIPNKVAYIALQFSIIQDLRN